jgi:UDP-3-O-acyl-N-acetylglucosamine deacetylase
VGLPIQGHVRVERGGHSVHLALVAAILAHPDAWEIAGGEPGADEIAAPLRVAAAGAS